MSVINFDELIDQTIKTDGVTVNWFYIERISNVMIGRMHLNFTTTIASPNGGLVLGRLKYTFFYGSRLVLNLIDENGVANATINTGTSIYFNNDNTVGLRCYRCLANHTYNIDEVILLNT